MIAIKFTQPSRSTNTFLQLDVASKARHAIALVLTQEEIELPKDQIISRWTRVLRYEGLFCRDSSNLYPSTGNEKIQLGVKVLVALKSHLDKQESYRWQVPYASHLTSPRQLEFGLLAWKPLSVSFSDSRITGSRRRATQQKNLK